MYQLVQIQAVGLVAGSKPRGCCPETNLLFLVFVIHVRCEEANEEQSNIFYLLMEILATCTPSGNNNTREDKRYKENDAEF